MVNKILQQQFHGINLSGTRWKRVLSDNSQRFINSILLESKTKLMLLQNNEKEASINLKIDNITTNIILHVKSLNFQSNPSNQLENDTINNPSIQTTFTNAYQQFENNNTNNTNNNNKNNNNIGNNPTKTNKTINTNPSIKNTIKELQQKYNVTSQSITTIINTTNWNKQEVEKATRNLQLLTSKTNIKERICLNVLLKENGNINNTLNNLQQLIVSNNNNNNSNNNTHKNHPSHHHNNQNGGGINQ